LRRDVKNFIDRVGFPVGVWAVAFYALQFQFSSTSGSIFSVSIHVFERQFGTDSTTDKIWARKTQFPLPYVFEIKGGLL